MEAFDYKPYYRLIIHSLANITNTQYLQPFLAQSPPAYDSHMPSTPQLMSHYLSEAAEAHVRNPPGTESGRQLRASSMPAHGPPPEEPIKEYISKIGILASSMPYYHNQYMEKRKKNLRVSEGDLVDPQDQGFGSDPSLDTLPLERSTEEQAETSRRLKPHSRSTIQLQNITSKAAATTEANAHAEKKKNKTTRWQFGIRSRNQPLEAMHCIYKALKAQGAEWQVPPPVPPIPTHDHSSYSINLADARLSESPEKGRRSRPNHTPRGYFPDSEPDDGHYRHHGKFSTGSEDEDTDDDADPAIFPHNYLPKDPWVIHVRWRKDGLYPPGSAQATSAHSSMVDLTAEGQRERARRRGSLIGSSSSTTGSATSFDAAAAAAVITASNSCYVYMDVQLYMLEAECYLVDFKCAGYENIVETIINDLEKKMVGCGVRVADKDVTSPQPFLDLTNKLVIHLARG